MIVSFVQCFGTAIHISSLHCWDQQICSRFGSTNTATTQTGTLTIYRLAGSESDSRMSHCWQLKLESLKCSCFFSCNCLWVGQINNAKRSLIISSSGKGAVSGSGPQALPGNTRPQATGISSTWQWQAVPGNARPQAMIPSTGRYSGTGHEESEDLWC